MNNEQHQSRSERRIAELEAANKVMAVEFNLFMKAVIISFGDEEGKFYLTMSTLRDARDEKGVVKIEGFSNAVEYSICEAPPEPLIVLPS